MSSRQDARRHMASTLGDHFIDPIFQLQQQQPALDVPSPVPPPAPSAAPSSSAGSGLGQGQGGGGGGGGPSYEGEGGGPSGGEGLAGGSARFRSTRGGVRQPAIPPGMDTSTADLTYRRNARTFSANNPSPEGWVYPHKKGIGTGSNLEAFKADIEARTRRGENCKTIADALVAMGVQTSDRAVSRVRIKWGMRKRAQRKTKTLPPESETARLNAKSKVQALRKFEITRMTQEGLSPEEICDNLTSRGMELKKGVATVLRLQSAWKLTHDEKRWVENFRHQCHKQAKAQQIQAFRDIAQELAVQDVDAWLEAKMAEQAAREARHDRALKLMGKHAPLNPERRKLQKPRNLTEHGNRQSNPDDDDDGDDDNDADGDGISDSDSDAGPAFEDGVVMDGDSYPTFHDQTDAGMDDNDDPQAHPQDSVAGVAANAFSRIDPSLLLQETCAPESAPPYPGPNSARTPTPSVSNVAPSVVPPSHSTSPRVTSAAAQKAASRRGKRRPPTQAAIPPPTIETPLTPDRLAQLSTSPSTAHPHSAVVPQHHQGSPLTASNAAPVAVATTRATPAPTLVLPPEEAEANRTALSTLDQYNAAAQAYKELLQARNENTPLLGSLTGLPPSSKEVEAAKRKLKEVTQAMMLSLE